MNIDITALDDFKLWELASDISTILERKANAKNSDMYMMWYKAFQNVQNEIDKRLIQQNERN